MIKLKDFDIKIQTAIDLGLRYLSRNIDQKCGFQSEIYHSENTEGELPNGNPVPNFPPEIFTSIVALDLLGCHLKHSDKKTLLDFVTPSQKYTSINFNKTETCPVFPNDTDSTSVTHCLLLKEGIEDINSAQIKDVGRIVLLNQNQDGIIQTYLPPRSHRENRICSGVIANALRFLYMTGLHRYAMKSEDYLMTVLKSEKSLVDSGYYYKSTDILLYLISQAVTLDTGANVRFHGLLLERLRHRFLTREFSDDEQTLTSMGISSRILASKILCIHLRDDIFPKLLEDLEVLLKLQSKDGSWPKDHFYRMGRHNFYFGGNLISTVFAVGALIKIKDSFMAESLN